MLRWVLLAVMVAALAALPAAASAWPAAAEYAYVINAESNSVSAFDLSQDGTPRRSFCQLARPDCPTGAAPTAIAADPAGRFVYVADGNGVSAFRVGSFGLLQPIKCRGGCSLGSWSGTRVGSGPLVVDPTGRYLFVAGGVEGSGADFSGGVLAFRIAPNGALTRIPCQADCFPTGALSGIAVDPSGQFVYATSAGRREGFLGFIAVWRVGADGSLTRVNCEAGQCRTGEYPGPPVIDPTGRHLYLRSGFGTNDQPEKLTVFSLGSDGKPTEVPCAVGCDPQPRVFEGHVALNPAGNVLYTIDNQISAFNADDGALSPIPCAGDCSTGGAWALKVEPRGRFIYALDPWGNRLLAYSIRGDGSVDPISCPNPAACATGQNPWDLVVVERHVPLTPRR